MSQAKIHRTSRTSTLGRVSALCVAVTILLLCQGSIAYAQGVNDYPGSSYPGCPSLGLNSSGNCVVRLQSDLKDTGDAGPDLQADGLFGPQTLQAVNHLQGRYDLPQDGVVGPMTIQLIQDSLTVSTPSASLAPAELHPARAAGWAYNNADVNKAFWRAPSGDHCTEFVSTALVSAGMPLSGKWYPFWDTEKAPGKQKFEDMIKNNTPFGGDVTSSPAWDNSFAFSDYFLDKGWVERTDLDLTNDSSALDAGARLGDIIVYDFAGQHKSEDGHVSMVTGLQGALVSVSQQGGGDDQDDQSRGWNYSTLHREAITAAYPGAKAWLLHWVQ